jgi:trimeric autotransporter adhesin
MKKRLLLAILLFPFFFLLSPCWAQVPQGFNYQAIVRNGSGVPLTNQAVPVRISIVTALTSGTVIWQEDHPDITSNQYGLISLVVGTGNQTGGTATSFPAVDWNLQALFLKTEIKYPGPGWTELGTSQIWAVPYSMVAKDVEGPIAKLGITGTTTDMEEALFEVKNQAGKTVFAVYNEGIRAYVGNGNTKGAKGGFSVGGYDATKGSPYDLFVLNTDSARFYIDSKPNLKGKRGGFSVGGYDMTKGVAVHDYLDVSKDSVRIYVDNNPLTKGKKGGFSVGGYDMTKGGIPTQDYMHVSKDSVRVYVDSNPATKGKRGGFAVGGYDLTKGGVTINKFLAVNPDSTRIFTSDANKGFGVGSLSSGVAESYLKLTPENYFIGHNSGKKTTTGSYNAFFGYNAGLNNTKGNFNIFIGYQSGYTNRAGDYNTFLGFQAGYFNYGNQSGSVQQHGRQNCYIGYQAGYSSDVADACVMVGYQAGLSNKKNFNTFIGHNSGYQNTDGVFNTFLGALSGAYSKTGSLNVFLGDKTGAYNDDGSNNVYIGTEAGYLNNGTSNVIIGASSNNQTEFQSTGGRNVIIGAGAATYNHGSGNILIGCGVVEGEVSLDDKLYIENSGDNVNPLIGGDFALNRLGVGRMPAANNFEVEGTASKTTAGGWLANSDSRIKTDITDITDPFSVVLKLRPVEFRYTEEYRASHPSIENRVYYNFIAQEYREVFPDAVKNSGEMLKGTNEPILQVDSYNAQIVSIKAVQELILDNKKQQQQIDNQQQMITAQNEKIEKLKKLVEELVRSK